MEIEAIKRLPLAEFCIQRLGYTPNKGHDSRLWRSLKSRAGETIITKSTPNEKGHYLFKCEERHVAGSLIDLLIHLHGMDFKSIHAFFRGALPSTTPLPATPNKQQAADTDNTLAVNRHLFRYSKHETPNYLTRRGLAPATIRLFNLKAQKETFALPLWRLKQNEWVKQSSIVYTIRHGKRLRFFQKNLRRKGSFTLFSTKHWQAHRTAYFFESPIDALSFYQIHKQEGAYIATCGNLTHDFLQASPHVLSHLHIEKAVIAFDNDSAGRSMLRSLAPILQPTITVDHVFPKVKDWNEQLRDLTI